MPEQAMFSLAGSADLVLRNGLVIDGGGSAGIVTDLAVRDGKIAAIGDLSAVRATETFDITGKILCPGFIDVHAHDDHACIASPDMIAKISQGVTTVVVGNCGIGLAPVCFTGPLPEPFNLIGDAAAFRYSCFADYANAVNDAMPRINVAALVGHSTLRAACMHDLNKAASPDEILAMTKLLVRSLDVGAIGMSSGTFYATGAAANSTEIIPLAREVGLVKGVYTAHIRNEYDGVEEALTEAFITAAQGDVSLVISHHKCAGMKNWGRSVSTLHLIETAAKHQPVAMDCYPYTAGSTVLLPDAADGSIDILVNWSETHPEASGKYLKAIAEEWHCTQQEAAHRLMPGSACYFQMHEDDMRRIMSHPYCMIGSDGLPSDNRPHPRLWGTFPRVLGRYARDLGLFPLETAIHKMTGLSAAKFGLIDRGIIKPGKIADLVVFDPKTIIDRATYDNPIQMSQGIDHVFVNGKLSWTDGACTGQRNGRFLRRQDSPC